ncbi:heme ABC exporter ATP-binding protein CcmA [Pseudoroseicyclus aestuarii]|uniref:Heme exporter protein A n=1 Tax=Pseudoroseicyclus aestuarii TaxID=1795041 RepID=A0A318T507_9RHOB|nr:heme ABC exporter ATP-binding protein CcmA [Pseudoroseicyclus aestuarii]PYE85444.1 heme exporter protein A [Pseudoroseicyclus aestuarii]
MPALTVSALACARGGIPLLEGVGFTVPEGTALILRGTNGIGKTTLLRTLAGLQPALSGTVTGAGDEAAYASHEGGVKAVLSVEENLAFWAALYGTQVPEAVYPAFHLAALRARPAGTLSAGQRRRLGLARLAVTGRPVLLLDEPTVSLDAGSTALFAGWLRGHLAAGGTALVATHVPLGLEAPELDLAPFRARAETLTDPFL